MTSKCPTGEVSYQTLNEGDLTDAEWERCKRDIYGGAMTHDDEKRIEQIETREKAATKGPWAETSMLSLALGNDEIATVYGSEEPLYVYAGGRGNNAPKENIRFIAHARDDIPWLLSKVRELQEEVKKEREATFQEVRTIICDTIKEHGETTMLAEHFRNLLAKVNQASDKGGK